MLNWINTIISQCKIYMEPKEQMYSDVTNNYSSLHNNNKTKYPESSNKYNIVVTHASEDLKIDYSDNEIELTSNNNDASFNETYLTSNKNDRSFNENQINSDNDKNFNRNNTSSSNN